jgi:Na+/proline symporter
MIRRFAHSARTALLAMTISMPVSDVEAQAGREPASRGRALAIEGLTAAVVSSAVMSVAVRSSDVCGENLACGLKRLGGGIALSAVAAPVASILVGRAMNTQPSAAGSFAGSLIGAVAALGALKILDESRIGEPSRTTALLVYGVVHGGITALGSRIFVERTRP